MLKRLLLAGVGLLAAVVAALLAARAWLNAPPPDPDKPANTSNASWRGFDSGYRHPATQTTEDANAERR